jgi:hypothetical protein
MRHLRVTHIVHDIARVIRKIGRVIRAGVFTANGEVLIGCGGRITDPITCKGAVSPSASILKGMIEVEVMAQFMHGSAAASAGDGRAPEVALSNHSSIYPGWGRRKVGIPRNVAAVVRVTGRDATRSYA